MKKACLLFIVSSMSVCLIACPNIEFSDSKNPQSYAEIETATEGLQLIVKNALPHEQVEGKMITNHLNAYLCAPRPQESPRDKNRPTIPTEVRCVKLKGMIENGTTEQFLVSKEDFARIAQQGKGQVSFEFMDQNQLLCVPFHCSSPNHEVSSGLDFSRKQIWRVEVNQRHTISYSCIVERIQ